MDEMRQLVRILVKVRPATSLCGSKLPLQAADLSEL